MQAMINFSTWLINNIPTFLMSEPVIYFVAIAIVSILIKMISALFITERRVK